MYYRIKQKGNVSMFYQVMVLMYMEKKYKPKIKEVKKNSYNIKLELEISI